MQAEAISNNYYKLKITSLLLEFFVYTFAAVLNCTKVNEYCNCTQDKCGQLPNTVCNPGSGACECDEDRKYLFKDGKCEKIKG